MSETVLLTGGTGFIGGHLLRRLLADGNEVVALVRTGHSLGEAAGLRAIAIESFEPAALQAALRGVRFDAAYHLAAYGVRPGDRDPALMQSVNVDAGLVLVEIAAQAGCIAFVAAGSSAEYAPGGATPVTENAPLEMERLYGASKVTGGLRLLERAATLGLPAATLRLFNAYGPGEAPHRLLPSLVRHLGAGERVPLSPGLQLRDFVHVDDIIDAFLGARAMLAADPARAGVYNVASGRPTSVRDFALGVAAACGAGPERLDFGAQPMRPDEIMFVVGDPSRFNQAAGWAPKLSLKAGIERSVAALKAGPATGGHA